MPLQHYIPATFLANFSKSIQTPRRNSLIWVGDKRTGKSFTAAISKVAVAQDLYTLFSFPPIVSALHVDEVMGEYEGDLDTAINALINGTLSAFTWAKVLVPFVAGILVRGPDFDIRFTNRFSALGGIKRVCITKLAVDEPTNTRSKVRMRLAQIVSTFSPGKLATDPVTTWHI